MNIPILFVSVCFPLRVLLVVGAYFIEQPTSTVPKEPFIALSIVMALGFLISNANSQILNKNKKVKGFAGGDKYWNSLAHSMFFILFAIFLTLNTGNAYIILLLDLIFGVITFVEHYCF